MSSVNGESAVQFCLVIVECRLKKDAVEAPKEHVGSIEILIIPDVNVTIYALNHQ